MPIIEIIYVSIEQLLDLRRLELDIEAFLKFYIDACRVRNCNLPFRTDAEP